MELAAHPLVAPGQVWLVDAALALGCASRPLVYLHPDTLARLRAHLWAQGRVAASLSYAELLIVLDCLPPG